MIGKPAWSVGPTRSGRSGPRSAPEPDRQKVGRGRQAPELLSAAPVDAGAGEHVRSRGRSPFDAGAISEAEGSRGRRRRLRGRIGQRSRRRPSGVTVPVETPSVKSSSTICTRRAARSLALDTPIRRRRLLTSPDFMSSGPGSRTTLAFGGSSTRRCTWYWTAELTASALSRPARSANVAARLATRALGQTACTASMPGKQPRRRPLQLRVAADRDLRAQADLPAALARRELHVVNVRPGEPSEHDVPERALPFGAHGPHQRLGPESLRSPAAEHDGASCRGASPGVVEGEADVDLVARLVGRNPYRGEWRDRAVGACRREAAAKLGGDVSGGGAAVPRRLRRLHTSSAGERRRCRAAWRRPAGGRTGRGGGGNALSALNGSFSGDHELGRDAKLVEPPGKHEPGAAAEMGRERRPRRLRRDGRDLLGVVAQWHLGRPRAAPCRPHGPGPPRPIVDLPRPGPAPARLEPTRRSRGRGRRAPRRSRVGLPRSRPNAPW